MKLFNDADRIKKDVLVHLIKAFNEDSLVQKVDKIPIIMRPRGMEASRCCIFKDRAILKYRIMAALGFGIEDETDETIPLNNYAEKACRRENISEKTSAYWMSLVKAVLMSAMLLPVPAMAALPDPV